MLNPLPATPISEPLAIELQGVSHIFGDGPTSRQVLREVTVNLEQHRIGVVGANGSGKSTFLRLLNALLVPSQGRVLVGGLDTRRQASQVRRLIGFVFTDPDAQIIMPTVAEDVAFGLRKSGLSKNEIAVRVGEALARFDLAGHKDHPAHLLSGGQKQLLAMAAVLICQPRAVVMDEPTTLLDLRNAAEISRMVASLDQPVILATHHLNLLADFDRVLVFDQGQIVADDAPEPAIDFYRRRMLG